MIAVDTNLLVYAHRSGVPEHRRSRRAIELAVRSNRGWGIALASVAEFWSIVTHPLVARESRAARLASAFLRMLAADAGMLTWVPGAGFDARLVARALELGIRGARVFDLQIALTALDHGATEIWTHDAGFVKVPGVTIRDPLA